MTRFAMLAASLLVAAVAVPLSAHHNSAAEFDLSRTVILKGKVSKIEWVNPHSLVHFYAEEMLVDGTPVPLAPPEEWVIEMGAPNALREKGITTQTVPIGTEIVVDGYPAKDQSKRLIAKRLTIDNAPRR